jgi:PAS fold.
MVFDRNITIFLLGIVCVAAVSVFAYLWPRRTRPGGMAFLLMLAAITVWAGADGLELASATLEQKLFWRIAQQFGIVFLPPSWLLFAFTYLDVQPWSHSRARWLLFFVPVLMLGVVLTNSWHHLFYNEVRLNADIPPQLEVVPGYWYWFHIGYSYLCLTSGLALIAGAFWHASPLFRRQMLLLGIGLVFPFLSNWIYLSRTPYLGVDLTPISLLLSAPFILFGLYQHRFLNLTPIARNRLIEVMSDAMVVINEQWRIVDLNPAAQQLFGSAMAINNRLETALKWPSLLGIL